MKLWFLLLCRPWIGLTHCTAFWILQGELVDQEFGWHSQERGLCSGLRVPDYNAGGCPKVSAPLRLWHRVLTAFWTRMTSWQLERQHRWKPSKSTLLAHLAFFSFVVRCAVRFFGVVKHICVTSQQDRLRRLAEDLWNTGRNGCAPLHQVRFSVRCRSFSLQTTKMLLRLLLFHAFHPYFQKWHNG